MGEEEDMDIYQIITILIAIGALYISWRTSRTSELANKRYTDKMEKDLEESKKANIVAIHKFEGAQGNRVFFIKNKGPADAQNIKYDIIDAGNNRSVIHPDDERVFEYLPAGSKPRFQCHSPQTLSEKREFLSIISWTDELGSHGLQTRRVIKE
ncbi:MAG: hypothetical protein ABIJ42_05445 [Acidobacteriota bacterium]